MGGLTKRATPNTTFFVAYCAGNIAGRQLVLTSEKPEYQVRDISKTSIAVTDIKLDCFYCNARHVCRSSCPLDLL